MFLKIVHMEIEKEYGQEIENRMVEPIGPLDVINMLDFHAIYAAQIIQIFEYAKESNIQIFEWFDFTYICKDILTNHKYIPYKFDLDKINSILQRAIVADYYGLPLLPNYTGRGMGHISDITTVKKRK